MLQKIREAFKDGGIGTVSLALLLTLSVIMGAGTAAAANGNFTVEVTDSDGNVPEDGTLTLTDDAGNTVEEVAIPDSGAHLFENLDDGTYTLEAYSHGSSIVTHDIEVTDGEVYVDGATTSQDYLSISLADAQQYDATFTVEDTSDGAAIPNATVELVHDGEVVTSGETDETGAATLTANEGKYTAEISHEDYEDVTIEEYTISGNQTKTVQMQEDDTFWAIGDSGDSGYSLLQIVGGLFALLLTIGLVVALRDE